MKTTLSVLGLVAALAFAPAVSGQTNVQMNLGVHGTPTPMPFIHHNTGSILKMTMDRMEEKALTRFNLKLWEESIVEDDDFDPEVESARYGSKLVGQSARHALKQFWKSTPLKLRLDEKKWSSRGSKAEGSTSSSGFSSYSGLRLTRDESFDPVREDPYLQIKWKLENEERRIAENVLRFELEKWQRPELSYRLRIPISAWHLEFGAEYRFRQDETREVERYGRFFTEIDRAFEAGVTLARRFGNGLFRLKYDVGGQGFAILALAY